MIDGVTMFQVNRPLGRVTGKTRAPPISPVVPVTLDVVSPLTFTSAHSISSTIFSI